MITQEQQTLESNKSYQYVFTVFTATYNRAYTLPRVYESLKAQTYCDFEWLIIDDGSTDNTKELVEQWQEENQFPIRYIYQQNGGLHIALNRGARVAQGELFLQLDSDDSCVPEALERLKYHWDSIPLDKRENFTGVTGLCNDQYGNIVGNLFPYHPIDSDVLEIRYRFKVIGEKWGFNRTDILRQFPYSEEIRGGYISQNVIWNKIARQYKTRFVNEFLRIYWTDQPSIMRNTSNPGKNALGERLSLLTILNEEIDWFKFAPVSFLRAAIHYSRFSFHLNIAITDQMSNIAPMLGKLLWLIVLPIGYLLYFKDKNITK
ncbi:glycosyltransferase family 2 protein [Chlorogloeopsis sp. ULAP01]|uniref:glycosyltransferase family A protein n=1 Tax=Chlorogloeopsis sp. ULAP01 TaxID=3056483 RepID=UPI0025AAFF53|nr:glycosyltransferase family 2 protein [Chlorogloeopsis sp. ULAP01]MDM9381274.1 glycosyltransferase family 2 protein [Chlorogloeopsis sp. ULAP01]